MVALSRTPLSSLTSLTRRSRSTTKRFKPLLPVRPVIFGIEQQTQATAHQQLPAQNVVPEDDPTLHQRLSGHCKSISDQEFIS